MAEYPVDYDFHVVLRDGGLAHIRPIKPTDAVIVGMYDQYTDQAADNAAMARKFGTPKVAG